MVDIEEVNVGANDDAESAFAVVACNDGGGGGRGARGRGRSGRGGSSSRVGVQPARSRVRSDRRTGVSNGRADKEGSVDRSRNYCFTLNNYDDAAEAHIQSIECRYLVYGREVGDSGTPHLQGYLSFSSQRRFNGVRELFLPYKPHIEVCKGSPEQNDDYARKDGDVWCKGVKPMSQKDKGVKNAERWELALSAAKEGRLDDIPDDIRFKHYNTCKMIMKDHLKMPADIDGLTGLWIYGLSGCGKSRYARYTYPNAYLKMANKWWDGYQDQPYVILEDLDPRHNGLGHHLKLWSDRYSFLAETKGGATAIRPQLIIITSQYSISECFDDPLTIDALTRRCTVMHMTEAWAPPDEVAPSIPEPIVIPRVHIE